MQLGSSVWRHPVACAVLCAFSDGGLHDQIVVKR
jgi:hypothetical protein